MFNVPLYYSLLIITNLSHQGGEDAPRNSKFKFESQIQIRISLKSEKPNYSEHPHQPLAIPISQHIPTAHIYLSTPKIYGILGYTGEGGL